MIAIALAWPVLVWLTPASSRPWISGTSDNSIWSLIWEYNGFGRLEGQTGGPASFGGGGGGPFGGASGPFRLLNEALGGQAGWLLGAATVGGLGIAALCRLRRTDPRTGWVIAVGGAFAVTAVAFSFAGGIFHPYYTSLLAPFAAALVGATFGQVLAGERAGGHAAGGMRSAEVTRVLGAVAIGAGAIVELLVLDHGAPDLDWLVVPLVVVAVAAVGALLFADPIARRLRSRGARGASPTRIRLAALACGLGILLAGPAIWSVDTLGHPTSGTFPTGGPESASTMGGPGGIPGGGVRSSSNLGRQSGSPPGPTFGEGGPPSTGEGFGGAAGPASIGGAGGAPSMGGAGGGMFGGEDLTSVVEYTEAHGGGTIAVDSQSGAAASIIEAGAEVAGIGGFSGKESSVSVTWLEERIESGAIAWIYTSGLGGGLTGSPSGAMSAGEATGGRSGATSGEPGGGAVPVGEGASGGDTRTGSESAIDTVLKSCAKVESSKLGEGSGSLYKCG
jgi:hypothetical protein